MEDIESGYPELDAASTMLKTDPKKSLVVCDEFAKRNPENWMLHLTRIMAYNHQGEWQGAMKSANDYVRFRPDHPQPYWERAEAAHRVGLYAKSIADISKAVKLDEDGFLGSMPYRLMAMNQACLGNLQEAMSNADKAAQMEDHEWFPPMGCIPSGTMPEFKAYLQRLTDEASL